MRRSPPVMKMNIIKVREDFLWITRMQVLILKQAISQWS